MKIHTTTTIPLVAIFVTAIMLSVPPAFAESQVTIDTVDGSGFGQDCAVSNGGSGCYTPMEATVDVGGKVMMVNSDPTGAAHSFTSGTVAGFSPSPDGIFDSGLLNQDESFEWTPDAAGEYPYYCFLHTWMVGTIAVQEASAQTDDEMKDDSMMEKKMEMTMKMEEVEDDSVMKDMMMKAMKMDLNEIMAEIKTSEGMANELMTIDLTMTDLEGNGIEHITYKIKATQGSEIVLDEEGHMHKGTIMNTHMTSTLPMDASETMPVVISVESVGFGHDDLYVDVPGEIATKQVVPEFGTIAAMILAVAIISIIAVSAKSRLSIMPRL